MHEVFESNCGFCSLCYSEEFTFLMLNFICHLFAQIWSCRMFCGCECDSAKVSIFQYNALSSANSLILEVKLFSMSSMYRTNCCVRIL